ncbi:MAG TPA: hypothetical protein VFQ41_11050 [Candidatus Angelobacter sp.]|nr:hypothetical protein [Candidatus Angelobacter sp.]
MAVLDVTQKMDIYESLSTINSAFAGIVHHIQAIQQAGVITPKYNRLFSGFTRELQAEINSDILDHLHDRELEDWSRFGKVRQTYEKRLRDPDDVFIQAEQRKKELAKKRKQKKQ